MSRIESGKLAVDCQWITPADVLGPCIEIMRPIMAKRGITFEAPLGMSEVRAYECWMDPMKMRQMIMNLLNNACKFTGEGGRITLRAENVRHDESTAVDRIIIEDTGCGMSSKFLARAFEPFEQEKNIYSGSVQGTGLGLTIARRFAEAMGGGITAESELGVGSKFIITVPYSYRPVDSTPAPDSPEPEAPGLEGVNILLAEDNAVNAKIAQKLLEKLGARVTWEENGEAAVKRFADSAEGAFDAVLMDIRMPRLDGLGAARVIRALPRGDAASVPIIAMSANAFEEDVRASLDAGMNAHLSKPVDPRILCDTLRRWISARNG